MPALVFLGRRWNIGSDDFVISSAIDLCIRGIWLVIMVLVLLRNDKSQCNEEEIILLGFLGINHASIVANILLLQSSRKGSIMDTNKRKSVPLFLGFRVIIECISIIWTILCTMDVASIDTHVGGCIEITNTSSGLVIFNWIILVIHLIILSYCFDSLGASKKLYNPEEEASTGEHSSIYIPLPTTKYGESWKRRCRLYCCAFLRNDIRKSKRSKDAFIEIAKIFGAIGLNQNLTNSDVTAGLLLMSYQTRLTRNLDLNSIQLEGVNVEKIIESENEISKPNEDWTSVENIYHYTQFACAPFLWFNVVMNEDKSVTSMMKYFMRNCCSCKTSKVQASKGMKCCSFELAGLEENLDGKTENVVYASFDNKPFEIPFLIILDHETKSLVISVRGSLSLNDFLVDFAAWPTQIPGYPDSFKAHHGILSSSLSLKEKIDSAQILSKTFQEYPNYNLILTGHSLGSGCATILALLYYMEYPNLKCYAYGAPGAVLTKEAAEYCDEFVTSIVFNDDLIARLGIPQIVKLKHSLKKVIENCNEPKYLVFLKSLFQSNPTYNFKTSNDSSPNITSSHHNTQKDLTKPIVIHEEKLEDCFTSIDSFKPESNVYENTYLPGKVFYIKKANENNFNWRWAKRTEFQDIIVSKRMIWDHMPTKIPKALKMLISSHK